MIPGFTNAVALERAYCAVGDGLLRVLRTDVLSELRQNGLQDVRQYGWSQVRDRWARVYGSALAGSRIVMEPA